MSLDEGTIQVYADWLGLGGPKLLGTLYVGTKRGAQQFSFEYSPDWIRMPQCRDLDPDLRLYRGRQYPDPARELFGLFMDSAPDRWGRLLMRRREAILARREGRKERQLHEADYLLGVHDAGRMGGLRFKLEASGPFLSSDLKNAIPPWKRLRELEAAARLFELDDTSTGDDAWLDLLVAPGSSLGGARPKATILDNDGSLWIAKFPSPRDSVDAGAWEKVLHDLARLAGLHVPESRLERFSEHGSTFLVKRFDRTAVQDRIHFASAMTMLEKTDGSSAADGSSYLELVAWIRRNTAEPMRDLEELWKRIAFSIAVSNTDDHLRNHGFVFSDSGWSLSPMYDINPDPQGRGLSLNISETDNSLDFNLALEQAPFFRVSRENALSYVRKLGELLENLAPIATSYGIQRRELQAMNPAFRRFGG